jgi:glycosyltransferase involved in cell wall biosynthesis
MTVNVFLSSQIWSQPRNTEGVRHHVKALYEEAFRGRELRFMPIGPNRGLLRDGLRHVPTLLRGTINVLTPGYPVIAGALALTLQSDLNLIVHTWKVPGYSDDRLSAHLYDAMLTRVIRRARAVVVASHVQKRQLEAMGLNCPVIFSPVTVDANYWHPLPDDRDSVLARFNLTNDGYVLTVGGNDRDEVHGARLAKSLGIPYVRASNDKNAINNAGLELERHGFRENCKLLLSPNDNELRALYGAARVVCLQTKTATNPAGLTALVEAMACGALVEIATTLAEGYVEHNLNGLLISDNATPLSNWIISGENSGKLRSAARTRALTTFDVRSAASRFANQFAKLPLNSAYCGNS